ncbi:MAG TPA: hypothetical protein VGI27_00595, partial [Solirubrobacteraceae bacterium]
MPSRHRHIRRAPCAHLRLLAAACCATLVATPVAAAGAKPAAYAPGRVLVKYVAATPPRARAASARAAGAR